MPAVSPGISLARQGIVATDSELTDESKNASSESAASTPSPGIRRLLQSLGMRQRTIPNKTRVMLTGRITALTEDRVLLGRGGATIYFTTGVLPPDLALGDMISVITVRVGARNVAEKITRVRYEL